MDSKLQSASNPNSAAKRDALHDEYDNQRIVHIIRRYYELRSSAEITSAQYGYVSGSNNCKHGKDDILCVLADIDRGETILSPRQLEVVKLLKMGYLNKEIGKILGLSQVTVSFHIHQASSRLSAYLNDVREGQTG